MNRPRCIARLCLAVAASAAALLGDAPCTVAEQPAAVIPISGETVEADAPTTYRLPLIGLCDPAEEHLVLGTAAPALAPTTTGEAAPAPSTAGLAFPANSNELTKQLLPAVQRGYNLAQRGAFLAARTEFIQVLRRVAQAKDATAGTNEFSTALAAGLRAMDEADDFVPEGAQLEGELNVRSMTSSHRTPVLRDRTEDVLPQEAVGLYHKFAQERLAHAAIDEQAGSMALYGLGKVYARLAERRDDDVTCIRGAMTMYCAALDACPNNNLAANELGVLQCRTGHPNEAVENFQRAITIAPSATAYHNLAVAQQKLGLEPQSAANEQESQRLAAWDRANGAVSRRAGVQWVSPAELARVSQPAQLGQATTEPVTASKPQSPNQQRSRY
jgi:tetratricopeptide (TPR) repeat protein